MATPGHTPEHVVHRLGDSHRLSGDALRNRGCGRTDVQNGDAGVLDNSLQQLLKLPDGLHVFPGHASRGCGQSRIREERERNPRLAGRSRKEFIALMANLRLAPPMRIAAALPANRHRGDWQLGAGEPSERGRHQQAMEDARAMEATNKEITNDSIGIFI